MNSVIPKKYIGTINHSCESQYLAETKGIVLVKTVISIQESKNNTDFDIGCNTIFLLKLLYKNAFIIKTKSNKINNGSVNSDKSNGVVGKKKLRVSDSDVKKTIRKYATLVDFRAIIPISKAIGAKPKKINPK